MAWKAATFGAMLLLVLPLGASVSGGLTYRDCMESEPSFLVPEAYLAPMLPEGFAPAVSLDGAGLLYFLVDATLSCKVGGETVVDNVVWTFVEPPEELRVPGVEYYLLFLDVIAGSPQTYGMFQAAGFGPVATLGENTLEVLRHDELGLVTNAVIDDGATRIEAFDASLGETIFWPGAEIRIFGAHEGELHGRAAATYTDHSWTGVADQYVAYASLWQQGPGALPETPIPVPVLGGHEFGFDMVVAPDPLH